MTKRIGVIAKRYPYLARVVEISFYGAILSLLQYVGNALVTNDFGDYKVALGMFITSFVTGVVSGVGTYIRRKKEELETSNNENDFINNV